MAKRYSQNRIKTDLRISNRGSACLAYASSMGFIDAAMHKNPFMAALTFVATGIGLYYFVKTRKAIKSHNEIKHTKNSPSYA